MHWAHITLGLRYIALQSMCICPSLKLNFLVHTETFSPSSPAFCPSWPSTKQIPCCFLTPSVLELFPSYPCSSSPPCTPSLWLLSFLSPSSSLRGSWRDWHFSDSGGGGRTCTEPRPTLGEERWDAAW